MGFRCISFVLALCSLIACHDDQVPQVPVQRTVIVYLGIDNNFVGEYKEKVDSLTRGWRKEFGGHLLVYADRGGEPSLTEIYWDGDKGANRVVKRYADSNSADPEVFRSVLTDIVAEYPADSYGLVVLSHASGWLPEETQAAPRSVVSDKGDEMELRDFAAAFPVKMDFVIFDACLMGGVEVAYEFKDKVDYLLSSPAEVLVPGFVYRKMVGHLMKDEADLVAVAKDFYDYYNGFSGMMRSATVSVVKTSELDGLMELSREILHGVDGEKQVNIRDIQRFGYGGHYLYFDFEDYIKALAPDRLQEFQKEINKCMIYKATTPGYYSSGTYSYSPINAYCGLTVYIPQAAYPFLNGEYLKLKWGQAVYL